MSDRNRMSDRNVEQRWFPYYRAQVCVVGDLIGGYADHTTGLGLGASPTTTPREGGAGCLL